MIVLCIDTATDACSAAVTRDGELLELGGEALQRLIEAHSEHARELALMVDELLGKLAAQGLQPEAIAISEGPGSYTGLRIGASLAKGLAYGRQIPLVAIPTLAVIAAAAPQDGRIAAQIDARHGQAYSALYEKQGTQLTLLREVALRDYAEAAFPGEAELVLTTKPDARYMGHLAEQKLAAGEHVDVAYWTPFYLQEYRAIKSEVKGLRS